MNTTQSLLGDIFAVSIDGKGSPSFNIRLRDNPTFRGSHGWGFGWYPNDDQSAMVAKDPAAHDTQVLIDALIDWSHFRSTVFFCKSAGASQGYSYQETQPFSKSFAGRDWLFLHNGDLDKEQLSKQYEKKSRLLEPLGKTDSELAFTILLSYFKDCDARRLSEVSPTEIHSWFQRFDRLGSSDMYFTDGQSIVCFHGTQSPKEMFYSRVQPPNDGKSYDFGSTQLELNDPRDTYRTAIIVSTSPSEKGEWAEMQPGQLIIIRRGKIIWSSSVIESTVQAVSSTMTKSPSQPKPTDDALSQTQTEQTQEMVLNARAISMSPEGAPLSFRLYEVIHRTEYEYTAPVQHSTHVFRLQPTDDLTQEVICSKLSISSPTQKTQYEDVFGNQAIHCSIDKPYSKLVVESTSKVKVYATPRDAQNSIRSQNVIPLIWMPWQRQMMSPYLLPPELPEPQLSELTDYAMSFVERNDYQLMNTLIDMNKSIYADYTYEPGSTSLNTTAFEVYASRKGVCQDFANLFICIARLLNIPARYRMGYIFTGVNYENKIQSDASHAWVEVYLPYIGWRGFDPTNGCTVFQDHIRVACGRNYIDATPTSGTIYKGGGTETLTASVQMREISE